jgi:hypothetical protein
MPIRPKIPPLPRWLQFWVLAITDVPHRHESVLHSVLPRNNGATFPRDLYSFAATLTHVIKGRPFLNPSTHSPVNALDPRFTFSWGPFSEVSDDGTDIHRSNIITFSIITFFHIITFSDIIIFFGSYCIHQLQATLHKIGCICRSVLACTVIGECAKDETQDKE